MQNQSDKSVPWRPQRGAAGSGGAELLHLCGSSAVRVSMCLTASGGGGGWGRAGGMALLSQHHSMLLGSA